MEKSGVYEKMAPYFLALMQNSLLRDEAGNPIGMIGTIRDITEQERAENALRVAEEELKKHERHLEELVKERTLELTAANERLVQEITERKRIEEELQKSQMQMAEAQKLAHVGSWEWDLATDKVTWSDELGRIFGTKAKRIRIV